MLITSLAGFSPPPSPIIDCAANAILALDTSSPNLSVYEYANPIAG